VRILYLTDLSDIHGAEANLLDLLANLDHEQHATFVGLPAAGRLTYQLAGTPTKFFLLPFPQVGERGFTMRHWWQAMRSATPLADYINQHRIDLVHSMTTASHLVGGLAAKKARVPAIWHARRVRPLNRVRNLVESTASRIIAPWDCVRDALIDQGVGEAKIVRINDGVDPHGVVPHTGHTLPERAALPKGTFVFGCVGNTSPTTEWPAYSIAAHFVAREAAHARFWTVGSVDEFTAAPPAELLHLGERDDLRDLYPALNCVVASTSDEQSARIALEAMCAGRPVIATEVGAHREALRGAGALVAARDAKTLTRAMLKLLRNPELLRKMSDAGRRKAAKEFGIRKHVEALLCLYKEVGLRS